MAKPIRNTPILYGKDAEQFFTEIENLPSVSQRQKERQRIAANVEHFKVLVASLKK